MKRSKDGFTLVELIVVMAIIALLAVVALGGFRSTQFKARDGQRKSDLKQVSNALEVLYNDYGRYPGSSGGNILACSYNPDNPDDPTQPNISGTCTWGTSEMAWVEASNKTIYFRVLPEDPSSRIYFYRSTNNGQRYQLYASLENTNDPDLITIDLTAFAVGTAPNCGVNDCNFAITSANITPFDD
ncbi:type II secretion system protein [Patescibacteria group bacterium]